MTSPRTLDFPLPPRRGSVPTDIRSPPLVSSIPPPSASNQQQQLARILELTNRYRTQTVTLLSRQEALAAEQKQVFDLERQLWVTEREIWEEERRLLTAGASGISVAAASAPAHAPSMMVNGDRSLDSNGSVQPAHLNNPTRFLSVSSMADSFVETAGGAMLPPPVPAPLPEPVASARKRDSTGVRLNWYLKHGMQHAADSSSMPNESVSPKGTRAGKLDSPRYAPSNDLGKPSRTISEADGEDDEDLSIPSSLIAEATKLIYGDKPSKRGSFSSNSTSTKRPVPALFKTLASDNQDAKSVRRASSSIYPSSKAAKYLATFSDDGFSDDEPEFYEAPRLGQKPRKRSASQTDKPNPERDIPLKLRPSSNFGAAFGSVSMRGGTQNQQPQNLAPPPPPRQGSISTSFYHPETPVDSFNSQHSFRDANWSGQPAGSIPKVPESSIGGDSMHSTRTVKPTVEPINVKSTPWGVTSTNVSSSPTFGSTTGNALKPSPSGLTSSLSIGSSQNSPMGTVPIPTTGLVVPTESDKFSLASSRYSQDENGIVNGDHVRHDSYPSHQNFKVSSKSAGPSNGVQKGKTSPPTYIWTPPPPISQLPTSPTRSNESMKSGLYGNTILLSPSTVAPSMKTSNPRLSAVGGVMPRSPSPPMMGRMGTSSMLLSVSSRSEGGDDLDDDVEDGDMGDVEIDTDEDDDGDVVEITNVGGRDAARVKSPELVPKERVKSPELRLGGANSGNIHAVVKKAQRMDYSGPPVEIVRDNSRWGNVLPGGMI